MILPQPETDLRPELLGGASANARPSFGAGSFTRRLKHKSWPVLSVVAVAILALAPAIFRGIPSNIDLWNHYRFALPFAEALNSGDPFPGWLAESNNGYGDPSFRFYPPATYYLLAAGRALTGNWYAGSLLIFTLLAILGAVGVYFWARSFLPRHMALWAGVLSALVPYHLNELYQSFLLAEYAGCAILPFAFAFTERVCRRGTTRDVLGLAVSFALLVLTHLPLTVIGGLALLAYGLFRLEAGKRLVTLGKLTLGALLGLAASAFYWVTMLAELPWIKANTVEVDASVDYRNNFLFSTFSPENLNVWWMNILMFATLMMLLPGAAFLSRARMGVMKRRGARAVALLFLFSFLMATPLSRPLWAFIRPLQEAQFPWRWLTIVSMAGSIMAASTIHFWMRKARGRARPLALLVAGSMVISLALSISHIIREANFLAPRQFETSLQSIPGSPSINYWLPVWVNPPARPMSSAVEAMGRNVSINSWEAERRVFQVSAGGEREARVRTFYYPHWTATANGQALTTRASEDGALSIQLPTEATTVELTFREPMRAQVAGVLSLLGWLLIAALFIFSLRRTKVCEYDSGEV